MKTTILILLALFLISCDKDEVNCECNGKYKLFTFPTQYYYKKTIIDCNTGLPAYPQNQENSIFIKCE